MEDICDIEIRIIAKTQEEVEAAIGELDENMPIVAFTPPEHDKAGKFFAQGNVGISLENIESQRTKIEQEKPVLDVKQLRLSGVNMEGIIGVKFIITAKTQEEVEATLRDLDENMPIVSFAPAQQNEDGGYFAEGIIGLFLEQVEYAKKVIADENLFRQTNHDLQITISSENC